MAEISSQMCDPVECQLKDVDLIKAEKELNETFESKKFSLWKLKEKLKGETELVSRTDDKFLLRFLRCRKFKVDAAFNNIKSFYRYQSKHPELFANNSLESLEKIFNMDLLGLLNYRDQNRSAVGVVRMGAASPEVASITDFYKILMRSAEKLIENEVTQINGTVLILDFKGFSFWHLKMVTSPSTLATFFSFLQDCSAYRVKGIHLVNSSVLVDILFKIAKTVIKSKILERMHIHRSNTDSLLKYFPKDILPKEYGGTQPPVDSMWLYKKLLEGQSTFNYDVENYGYHLNKSDDHIMS